MTKYFELPDGSTVSVQDDMTYETATTKAVKNFPELFYVKKESECGAGLGFTPIPLSSGGYACGVRAFELAVITPDVDKTHAATESGSYAKPVDLASTSLSGAIITGGCAAFLGFVVSLYFYRKFKSKTNTKLRNSLFLVGLVSFGFGLGGAANEILGLPIMGVQINWERVARAVLLPVIVLPVLLFTILKLIEKFGRSERASTAIDQKTNFDQMSSSSSSVGGSGANLQTSQKSGDDSAIPLDVWEEVLSEYEGESRNRGLYAKLYAENEGDENKIKAQYIGIRARQLSGDPSGV
jgi:hypothetical protein